MRMVKNGFTWLRIVEEETVRNTDTMQETKKLTDTEPMVPNQTCHGDQPRDKGDKADLKSILGPRKTQLEASDL